MKKIISGTIAVLVAGCLLSFAPNKWYPCHPKGDIVPCRHRHSGGDLVPCGHACYDQFGNGYACHPSGDVVPCVHGHPAGDVVPCGHVCY